jgi:branched-chain amino acid transport system substrate-binding protein
MKIAASLAFAAALMTTAAHAQTTNVKLGVLTDMSSLYADDTGPGSVAAAKLAVADFNPAAHNMNVDIVVADHQNKPDIGANIARQWFDTQSVDAILIPAWPWP